MNNMTVLFYVFVVPLIIAHGNLFRKIFFVTENVHHAIDTAGPAEAAALQNFQRWAAVWQQG